MNNNDNSKQQGHKDSEGRKVGSSTVQGVEVRGRLRRERVDAGSVRLSERDGQLLRVIGEQYAITVDQLARLIGRSHRTGRWLRDRWRTAGWVESRQLTAHGASFVWLTGTGTRVAGSPYRTWRPNAALAAHIEAVTEVRLLSERLAAGEWVCERSLARGPRARFHERPHVPDAILERAGERIAVEVELTLKSRARLEAVLLELGDYDRVLYFATRALVPRLRELAAELPWQNIAVHPYPPRAAALIA
jgi:hypothetical protein